MLAKKHENCLEHFESNKYISKDKTQIGIYEIVSSPLADLN